MLVKSTVRSRRVGPRQILSPERWRQPPVCRRISIAAAQQSGLTTTPMSGRVIFANRLFVCPVIYIEPYVMNSRLVFARIQAGIMRGAATSAESCARAFIASMPRRLQTASSRIIRGVPCENHCCRQSERRGGKTTTSLNLSAALSERGTRVLLADLDPQGNATSALALGEFGGQSLYQAMIGARPVQELVVPTRFPNLFAIPADLDMAGAEVEVARMDEHMLQLRRVLEPLRNAKRIRAMFLDCSPHLEF